MRTFHIFSIIFFAVLTFAFFPDSSGSVANNLAPIRLLTLTIFCIFSGLYLINYAGRGKPIAISINISKVSTLFVFLTGYLIWIIVSSIFSPIPGYAFMGMPSLQFGSLFLLFCYLTSLIFSSLNNTKWLIRMFSLITVAILVWTVAESIGFKPISMWLHSIPMQYPAASIGDRRHLSGWFAIMSLSSIFFYRKQPYDSWFWLWIISALAGIGLTTTTAATVGVGLGLLAWLTISFNKANWKLPALVLLTFGAFVLGLPSAASATATLVGFKPPQFKEYSSTSSFKPRLYLWKAAWNSMFARTIKFIA